jgi:hypothetical protein
MITPERPSLRPIALRAAWLLLADGLFDCDGRALKQSPAPRAQSNGCDVGWGLPQPLRGHGTGGRKRPGSRRVRPAGRCSTGRNGHPPGGPGVRRLGHRRHRVRDGHGPRQERWRFLRTGRFARTPTRSGASASRTCSRAGPCPRRSPGPFAARPTASPSREPRPGRARFRAARPGASNVALGFRCLRLLPQGGRETGAQAATKRQAAVTRDGRR